MTDRVRVVIIGPDGTIVSSRELDDPWYAAGCYRHPDQRQQARDELAVAELHDWLSRHDPASGTYTIGVAQLDCGPTDHPTRTWAKARLTHRRAIRPASTVQSGARPAPWDAVA